MPNGPAKPERGASCDCDDPNGKPQGVLPPAFAIGKRFGRIDLSASRDEASGNRSRRDRIERIPYWSVYCLYCGGYIADALLECVPAAKRTMEA